MLPGMDMDKAEIKQNPRWKTGWSQTPWLHLLSRDIANKEKKGKKSPLGEILTLLPLEGKFRFCWPCLLKIILEVEIFRTGSCTQCWCHCKMCMENTVFQQVATDWSLAWLVSGPWQAVCQPSV